MVNERPTVAQREETAESIREGGDAAMETVMEEMGITDQTPILDEAAAERAEGGGPVADAVDQLEAGADDFEEGDDD